MDQRAASPAHLPLIALRIGPGEGFPQGTDRVHDVSKTLRPEEHYDDETLMQKVKSKALGYWEDPGEIEIDITDGMVTVTGSVSDSSSRDRLICLIRDVDGVGLIDDRLTVGA